MTSETAEEFGKPWAIKLGVGNWKIITWVSMSYLLIYPILAVWVSATANNEDLIEHAQLLVTEIAINQAIWNITINWIAVVVFVLLGVLARILVNLILHQTSETFGYNLYTGKKDMELSKKHPEPINQEESTEDWSKHLYKTTGYKIDPSGKPLTINRITRDHNNDVKIREEWFQKISGSTSWFHGFLAFIFALSITLSVAGSTWVLFGKTAPVIGFSGDHTMVFLITTIIVGIFYGWFVWGWFSALRIGLDFFLVLSRLKTYDFDKSEWGKDIGKKTPRSSEPAGEDMTQDQLREKLISKMTQFSLYISNSRSDFYRFRNNVRHLSSRLFRTQILVILAFTLEAVIIYFSGIKINQTGFPIMSSSISVPFNLYLLVIAVGMMATVIINFIFFYIIQVSLKAFTVNAKNHFMEPLFDMKSDLTPLFNQVKISNLSEGERVSSMVQQHAEALSRLETESTLAIDFRRVLGFAASLVPLVTIVSLIF